MSNAEALGAARGTWTRKVLTMERREFLRKGLILGAGLVPKIIFLLPLAILVYILTTIVSSSLIVIDVLLLGSINLGIVFFLMAFFVRQPYRIFPLFLRATALFQVVLYIATAGLIFTNAVTNGMDAVGIVIQNYSEFVTGQGIGASIFAIFIFISFIMAMKSTERVMVTCGYFFLDFMPGNQMMIDAAQHSGILEEHEANRRRKVLAQIDSFYKAMYGTAKFVRGVIIAGIVIILVTVLGGVAIGMVSHGMPFTDILELFVRLVIGAGLAFQVHAMLMCVAMDLLTSRGYCLWERLR